jgi:hypothetical protein
MLRIPFFYSLILNLSNTRVTGSVQSIVAHEVSGDRAAAAAMGSRAVDDRR